MLIMKYPVLHVRIFSREETGIAHGPMNHIRSEILGAEASRIMILWRGAIGNDLSKDLALKNKIYNILAHLSGHLEFLRE